MVEAEVVEGVLRMGRFLVDLVEGGRGGEGGLGCWERAERKVERGERS